MPAMILIHQAQPGNAAIRRPVFVNPTAIQMIDPQGAPGESRSIITVGGIRFHVHELAEEIAARAGFKLPADENVNAEVL